MKIISRTLMKPPPKKTAISLQKDNQLFSVETFQCEIS